MSYKMSNNKYLVVDPPSGWKYGFPKAVPREVIDDDEAYTQFLLDEGYPEKDIPLALKHSRYWEFDGE